MVSFYRKSLDLLLDRTVQQAIELGALEPEYGHPHRVARRRMFDDWRIVRAALTTVWPSRDATELETIEELVVTFETSNSEGSPSDRTRMRLAFYTLHEFLLDVAVDFDTMIGHREEAS